MGPFIQRKRPWEPEVLSQYREPPPMTSHRGRFTYDNTYNVSGIACSCGWSTRDRRRYRANWERHQAETRRVRF